jgi:hypothetical protein
LRKEVPGWTWDALASVWESYFDRLLEWVNSSGSLPRQVDVTDDGFKLGSWVIIQRQFYRRNKLSADRIERLEKEVPGWTWKGDRSRRDPLGAPEGQRPVRAE